jgi:hypothetical protein
MSGEHSAVEKSIEDILIELMDGKFMSVGAHASSTRGVKPLHRLHVDMDPLEL